MPFLSTNTAGDSQRFELGDGDTIIGRHPDCNIVVEAAAVSRYHAKVTKQGDDYLVLDAGSRNGTFLNNELVGDAEILREGDRIRVSDVELIFHIEAIPGFALPGAEMTFEGSNFGIVMVDEAKSDLSSAQVEYRSSVDGLKMSATPEAKLEALMRINSNLSNALALDDVLPKVLESLFMVFPSADRGFVVMRHEDGSLEPRWVKQRRATDQTQTVRLSRTIMNKVMDTGEAILSLDATEDSRFESSESIADFSIRSMMCAPLYDGDGKAFGALQIDSIQGRGQFRDDDLDLLAGVATQAGVVINNARMHEQALAQQEVEQDLRLATEVQQAFLPQENPLIPSFQLSSFYKAAHHIGGDYFDYIDLPNNRVAIVVADVVGHGVAAAMFMAKLSAETRFCLASEPDLAAAIVLLNDRMSALQVERFVTFLVMVVDPVSESVAMVNAGHMAPVVRVAKDSSIVEPGQEESGLPIAIDLGMEYETVVIDMCVGDVAIMYTDGVNEAMNEADEEFGIEKVKELAAAGGSADEVRDRIVKSVMEHVGEAPPFDDMCIVVIERTSTPVLNQTVLADTVDDDVVESAFQ